MMTDIKIDLRVEKPDQASEDLFILQKTVSQNNLLKNLNMNYLIYEDFKLKSIDIDKMKKICVDIIKKNYITVDCYHVD